VIESIKQEAWNCTLYTQHKKANSEFWTLDFTNLFKGPFQNRKINSARDTFWGML
jgi:hypothetical protein